MISLQSDTLLINSTSFEGNCWLGIRGTFSGSVSVTNSFFFGAESAMIVTSENTQIISTVFSHIKSNPLNMETSSSSNQVLLRDCHFFYCGPVLHRSEGRQVKGILEQNSFRFNRNGALSVNGGDWTVTDCSVSQTDSNVLGAAIFEFRGDTPGTPAATLIVSNCSFDGTATDSILTKSALSFSAIDKVQVLSSSFSNNSASKGAVTFEACRAVEMSDCQFTGNSASSGAAISLNGVQNFDLKDSQFQGNQGLSRISDIFLGKSDGASHSYSLQSCSFSGGEGVNIQVEAPNNVQVSGLTFATPSGGKAIDCSEPSQESDRAIIQFIGDSAVVIDNSERNSHSGIGQSCTLVGSPLSWYQIGWLAIPLSIGILILVLGVLSSLVLFKRYRAKRDAGYNSINDDA
jgi:hypothetical protein